MAKAVRWIVTLSDASRLAQVRDGLRECGFKIADELGEIGVITGTADEAVAKKARRISGVADISPEGQVGIGPPGSPDTW